MSDYWESVADKTQRIATPEQFEAAAYRLVTEQVLYAADIRSRVAYGLIDQFEREFRTVLVPLGVLVKVNRQLRYAYALPTHAKVSAASTEHTLLALVLRKIYDESAQAGQFNDDGEVLCDLIELEEKFRLATRRELPAGGRLEEAMRTMKRWGIAKSSKEEDAPDPDAANQPYVVVIRPAIADLLGESPLQRLALFGDPKTLPPLNEETEDAIGGDDEGDKP